MDIRAQLLKERGRRNAEAVADHVGRDPQRFAQLMQCVLDDTRLVGQRAAYSAGIVCDAYPHLADPYVERLLDTLDAPVHEAVQRNSIRTLQTCGLPKALHGRITGTMFAVLADPARSIAQRACAITVAARLVERYPALANEFGLLLEEVLLTDPGPGVRSRAVQTLRKLRGASPSVTAKGPE